jgi:hypothetical protein
MNMETSISPWILLALIDPIIDPKIIPGAHFFITLISTF